MGFKVIFRDSFIEDLEGVVKSIAVHDPGAALELGMTVISSSEKLTFFPERHPRLRQRKEIRRFIIKKYFKVFYRVDNQSSVVEILRLWDGRRSSDPRFAKGA